MQREVKDNVTTSDRRQRIFSWLSLVTLGSALIIAFAVVGLGQQELRGNVAFGLIVIAILIDAANLFSYGANSRVQRLSRMSWILVAVICLLFSLHIAALQDPEARKAADSVLLTAMVVLAFPSGIVAMLAIMAYSVQFLATRGASASELLIFWFVFFASGYVQWFMLMPKVVARMRKSKQASS